MNCMLDIKKIDTVWEPKIIIFQRIIMKLNLYRKRFISSTSSI